MDDLTDIRERLEDVAVLFCSDHGGRWQWNEDHKSLTIFDAKGEPSVTLHVERQQ